MPNHMGASQRANKGAGKGLPWIVAAIVIGVLAAVYLAGVAAFNNWFMPGTVLDGSDVSLRPVSEVAAEKGESLSSFQVRLAGDGLDLTVTGEQVDLLCDGEAYARSAVEQTNPWLWPYEVFQTRRLTAEAGMSFDRAKLAALIQPTIDASAQAAAALGGSGISYDSQSKVFTFAPEVVAQHLSTDAVADAYEKAVAARAGEATLGAECLEAGGSVQATVDAANAYVAAATTLTLGGNHAFDIDADRIAGWVVIGEDGGVSLDVEAITAWCKGELSDLLDTVGSARTYTRPDGVEVTVDDGNGSYGTSTYGWIIDGSATGPLIAAALEGGKPTTVEIPATQSAAQVCPGGQDWGSRYVDVDLTEQHARFYDSDELIWEAPITTGQPNLGHATPSGVWSITNKQQGDINLRGPVDPETNEPEWDSHVNFWMGIVRNVIGFHNAPWQSVFGGNIYTYYGSHGCIRMSYQSAESLYALIQVGDVVVMHY